MKKEKNTNKKKKGKGLILILMVLIIVIIVLFLLFKCNKSYTVTFDTDGGSLIVNLEIKNGELINLPEPPTKEGYIFAGWVNESGEILTNGTKITNNINVKASWIKSDAKTSTIEFDTDGGNAVENIIIEKGKIVMLPMAPIKKGYTFVGWVNKDGKLIIKDMTINENITLKALWIKDDANPNTITFNTDGGSNIPSIKIIGGKIVLPVNPTKEGYVFAGWVDEDGNKITEETTINENITIKATWKEPYTCPDNCTPIGDGSKCTKTTIKDVVTYTGCPSGTETVEKFCTSHKKQISIGFDEDMTYETVGIMCNDNPKGFCVNYNSRYYITGDTCPSGYYKYVETEGLGATYGCAKKSNKGGTSCPSGYTKDGNKCKKTETLKCKAN